MARSREDISWIFMEESRTSILGFRIFLLRLCFSLLNIYLPLYSFFRSYAYFTFFSPASLSNIYLLLHSFTSPSLSLSLKICPTSLFSTPFLFSRLIPFFSPLTSLSAVYFSTLLSFFLRSFLFLSFLIYIYLSLSLSASIRWDSNDNQCRYWKSDFPAKLRTESIPSIRRWRILFTYATWAHAIVPIGTIYRHAYTVPVRHFSL